LGYSNNLTVSDMSDNLFTIGVTENTYVDFAGYRWDVSNGWNDPGGNIWSNNVENVHIDEEGHLHLKITYNIDGKWSTAEISNYRSLSYGKYIFYINGRPDLFDPHVVFALFTYSRKYGEIDTEFSKWGNIFSDFNVENVLHPCDYSPSTLNRFFMHLYEGKSTHYFNWVENKHVEFKSIRGYYEEPPSNAYLINQAQLTKNVPKDGDEKVIISLWLSGEPLSIQNPIEIEITNFKYYQQEKTIYINSPNGGEEWTLGSAHSIKWSAPGIKDNMRISLYKGSNKLGDIVAGIPASLKSYNWKVGNYLGGTTTAGCSYIIKIGSNSAMFSNSNPFFISPSRGLMITSPNGGEELELGSTHTIKWSAPGIKDNIRLSLYKGRNKLGDIVTRIPASQKSYDWNVGKYQGGTAKAGGGYTIEIVSDGNSYKDKCDTQFSIIPSKKAVR
jgi:hypothetical protein